MPQTIIRVRIKRIETAVFALDGTLSISESIDAIESGEHDPTVSSIDFEEITVLRHNHSD